MTLGEAIDQVLKLAEHTQTRLPDTHADEALRAIEYLREFQRGFCIGHMDRQRRSAGLTS